MGSTSGIGAAIAKEFAKEGAKVVVSGRRIGRGNQVVSDIKKEGGEAIFIQTDVTSPDQIKNLVDQSYKTYKNIDILVNNAGIEWGKPFVECTVEDFDTIIYTNLRSHFLASKYALEYMLKQKKGVILSISSATTVGPIPGINLYGIAKTGLNYMAKCIAQEYSSQGIRANVICPGLIHTEMFDRDPNGLKELIKATVPVGRPGTTDEIAKAALYLVSDYAQYTTGISLVIDGGQNL
jgi:NAD(P)-dependent dehydrogenase (short-subunit alcohol dehydrogenase family)